MAHIEFLRAELLARNSRLTTAKFDALQMALQQFVKAQVSRHVGHRTKFVIENKAEGGCDLVAHLVNPGLQTFLPFEQIHDHIDPAEIEIDQLRETLWPAVDAMRVLMRRQNIPECEIRELDRIAPGAAAVVRSFIFSGTSHGELNVSIYGRPKASVAMTKYPRLEVQEHKEQIVFTVNAVGPHSASISVRLNRQLKIRAGRKLQLEWAPTEDPDLSLAKKLLEYAKRRSVLSTSVRLVVNRSNQRLDRVLLAGSVEVIASTRFHEKTGHAAEPLDIQDELF